MNEREIIRQWKTWFYAERIDNISGIDSRACKWIHIHSYAGAKSKQQSRMGMYRKEYRFINKRPVFQQEGRKHYLWWSGTSWLIGDPENLGSTLAGLRNTKCNGTMDFPDSKCSSGWEYAGEKNKKWENDTTITISCFNKRACPEELNVTMIPKGVFAQAGGDLEDDFNGTYHQVNTDDSSILYKKIAEDRYLSKNSNGFWMFSNQEDIGSDSQGMAHNDNCIEQCPNYCGSDGWLGRTIDLPIGPIFDSGNGFGTVLETRREFKTSLTAVDRELEVSERLLKCEEMQAAADHETCPSSTTQSRES
jgi:hypothetical protein